MKNLATVVVTKTKNWYKAGQVLKVTYIPSVEMYRTLDGKYIEACHVKGMWLYGV